MKSLNLVLFLAALDVCSSARILGAIITPSYSHQIVFQPLWRELSLRGHQVTVITTDPINNSSLTNLTEIDMRFSYKVHHDALDELVYGDQAITKKMKVHYGVFDKIVEQQLSHPEVQKLIHDKDQHFDLLIVEVMHPAMFAFSKRFNCPFIIVSSGLSSHTNYDTVGSIYHPAAYPIEYNGYVFDSNTLIGRAVILISKVVIYRINSYFLSTSEVIAHKYFGSEIGPLQDIAKNFSMLFENSNKIFHPVKPVVPAIVNIGGDMEIRPEKPLQENLKKFLDDAKDVGAIYFSLGSNVNSTTLPNKTLTAIVEALSEIPHKVLWKFENEHLDNKSKNVIISKWFPQQDVLRHPSVRLFITHGGLQSFHETVYFKVPIVGIPFYSDQPFNVWLLVKKGVGLSLDYKTLTKHQLKSAVLEVMNNPKYRNRMAELSDMVKDEPMTGLEKAVWWSEYVIRYKGALHLRSDVVKFKFYEYYLLDMLACVLLFLSTVSFILYWTIKKTCKLRSTLFSKNKVKTH